MNLTPRQIRILLVGHSAGAAGRGFVSEDEEHAAWMQHRDELLRAAGSSRPAAYFKFELCEDTPRWILAVEQLFRAGLFSAEMAASMESRELTMSVNQSPSLHEQFSSPEQIRSSGRSYSDLEILLREFGHAQAWHAYRGRPELVEKYSHIGCALREVLRESLTILKPQESAN